MRMRIGFLGLGTMGFPMAHNLARAGYDVTVWNRTASVAAPKGATRAGSPREAAADRDLVMTSLSDERALDEVLEAALPGIRAGAVVVDTSTVGLAATRAADAKVRSRGASFVAAPVLGSKAAAEKAQLVVVAGGPAAARETARPALHAISARLFELDSPEQAALMKLVVNAVGGAMMTGFAEALALGAKGGLEVARMVETLQASGFHSPLYLMKGDQILQRDYAPRFATALAEKDQRLAQEAAAELGAQLPGNAAVRALLAEAVAAGRGDVDMSAVAELCFERAGVKR